MEKYKEEIKIYEDPKVLNVATQLAKLCLKDKGMLSLLIFHIIVVHNSKCLDGKLIHPTKEKVRKMCCCSDTKACNILRLAKENKFFFHYDDKKDILTARNIKKRYTKKYFHLKHGESWRIDVIQIARYNSNWQKINYSFFTVKKEIEKMLLLRVIKACDRNYKYFLHEYRTSTHIAFKYKCNIYGSNLFFPSYNQMCKIIEANSEDYVRDRISELIDERRIVNSGHQQLIYLGNELSDGSEEVNQRCKHIHTRVVDKHTGSTYAASPNIYSVTGIGYGGARNIILNHKYRMTRYYKKTKGEQVRRERNFAMMYDTFSNE